ncbi:MAG: hypothetical protein H6690_03350 [Erysipelotrichaceae bacterium]|nr:hypothetical protein [Erysipelotrichaceae bacterium]
MNLKRIAKDIHKNAIEKGFWDKENVAEKLMLIVSELSEAMEADRKNKFMASNAWSNMDAYNNSSNNSWMTAFEANIKDTFEDELADTFIRLLDLAERKGVDLEKHVQAKHKYNKLRPFMHGKKY